MKRKDHEKAMRELAAYYKNRLRETLQEIELILREDTAKTDNESRYQALEFVRAEIKKLRG